VKRLALATLLALGGCRRAAPPAAAPVATPGGESSIASVRLEDWTDAARSRTVPVKLFLPAGPGKAPLVIWSPGLGGTRDAYGYLAEDWQSHGYAVIALTHPGSDNVALREAVRAAGGLRAGRDAVVDAIAKIAADPDNLRNRPKDVSFVLDHALADPALSKRIDAEKVGVAGHSFGAYTASAVMGMIAIDSFRDPRFKAGVMMSPQGIGRMNMKITADSWKSMGGPALYLTGTEDRLGGETPEDRRLAFDRSTIAGQFLVVFTGANHMTFSDADWMFSRRDERDPRFHPWIQEVSREFFDAYLRGDATAKTWMTEKKLVEECAGACTMESK
jgi:predicted dienelactone hydrolase